VLEGIARRGLLIILDVVADLKGRRPRTAGEIEDPGIITSDISRQGRARTLPSLLYLRGGGSCHALEGVALLRGHCGLTHRRSLLLGNDGRLDG
jgi:hypothetical protein